MATTTEGTTQLLDQLQNEVNRVMEQMGRVFVAANANPKTAPVVQANKLKEILPGSIDNFHDALDQLEHELQLAKLVMRRDLAVCRERSGIVKSAQTNGMSAPSIVEQQQESSQPAISPSVEVETKPDEDTAMQDAQPNQDTEMTDAKAEVTAQEQNPTEATNMETKPADQSEKSTAQPDTTQADSKPSDTALQIDTKPASAEATQDPDDQPPDTGTFTNDFDSLFGGPTSAGPVDGGDFNNNTEFDFGSFAANGAENDDNITSLLPGLQDYANNQSPAHVSDFDKIFDLESVPIDPNQTQNDNTFDDLLDFEDFTSGDYGGTEGNGQNGGDGNFDFDFGE